MNPQATSSPADVRATTRQKHQSHTPAEEALRRFEEQQAAESASERAAQLRREEEERKLAEARAVEISITPVSERPQVKAIREKIAAEEAEAARELKAAEAAREAARTAFNAADRAALETEVAIDTGETTDREEAQAALKTAQKNLEDAEARLSAARRQGDRQEQRSELLTKRLAEAEQEARSEVEREARELLAHKVALAREATAAAVAAHDELFSLELALSNMGVEIGDRVYHLRGLLSSDVAGVPTTYSDWINRLEAAGYSQ